MIINPGSENKGGTFERALEMANEWLVEIVKEYPEVTVTTDEDQYEKGMWSFKFTHGVTGKEVFLNTHGFTKEECEKFMFYPRIYWNGSSTGNPEIKDWLTDDFEYVICYKQKSSACK